MTEIVTVAGLDDERLEWVASLYGNADPKYRDRTYLRHLFLANPVGPSLHAFAVDDGTPVGHCCVVRTRALLGASDLPAGKLEALWLESSHRGRDVRGESVSRALLRRLYAFSDEQGVELVHALATPGIGRVIGFEPLSPVGERTLVSVVGGASLPVRTLALAQRVARGVAALPAASGELRAPTAADADLAEVPTPAGGRWAVVAGDAWEWYRSSPLLAVLEVDGARALVQLPALPREPLRLVGWSAGDRGMRSALRVLAAAGRLARARGAATTRFQPWAGPSGDGTVARACRATGFVRRDDLTTVWVRTRHRALARADAAVSTPFLYLGF